MAIGNEEDEFDRQGQEYGSGKVEGHGGGWRGGENIGSWQLVDLSTKADEHITWFSSVHTQTNTLDEDRQSLRVGMEIGVRGSFLRPTHSQSL